MNILNKDDTLTNALYMLMETNITRYLMINTYGRLDGARKATNHLKLVEIYIQTVTGCGTQRVHQVIDYCELLDGVHEATQELTDHLDTEIGFPLLNSRPDYSHLVPLFFIKFRELADKFTENFKEVYPQPPVQLLKGLV